MKHRIWIVAMALVFAFGLFAGGAPTIASANGGTVHCVKYGETLYGIGAYYGVSANAIAQHNGLWNPNYIRAGMCLHIPAGWNGGQQGGHGGWNGGQQGGQPGGHGGWNGGQKGGQPGGHGGWDGACAPGAHCVKYGETLWGIAYRHGISVHAIAKANGIWNYNFIRAGQCLVIPSW